MSLDAVEKFRFLVAAAIIDGEIQEEELGLLTATAIRLRLSREEARGILSQIKGGGEVPLKRPEDPGDREQLILSLIELVVCDEAVTPREWATLYRFAKVFSLARAQIEALVEIKRRERKLSGEVSSLENIARFRLLVAAALADGEIDEEQCGTLEAFAAKLGLSKDDADAVLGYVADHDDVTAEAPEDAEESTKMVMSLMEVVVDDEIISDAEMTLLLRVGSVFGLPEAQIRGIAEAVLAARVGD